MRDSSAAEMDALDAADTAGAPDAPAALDAPEFVRLVPSGSDGGRSRSQERQCDQSTYLYLLDSALHFSLLLTDTRAR